MVKQASVQRVGRRGLGVGEEQEGGQAGEEGDAGGLGEGCVERFGRGEGLSRHVWQEGVFAKEHCQAGGVSQGEGGLAAIGLWATLPWGSIAKSMARWRWLGEGE